MSHFVAAAAPIEAAAPRAASPGWLLLQRLVRRKVVLLAIFVLLVMAFCAISAPWIAPYSPTRMDVVHRLAPPSAAHWLGSDDFGRDVLTRCMYGARLSLTVGFLVVVTSLTCGTVLGVVSGYVRRLDGLLMRVTDALMAFPDILLAIALMASLGPSARNVVLALSFVYTPRVARVVRGSVLVVASLEYIDAAHAIGARALRILVRHILINCASPVIVQATFITAYAMLGEAALSFLGVGIPPQIPTWGGIISQGQVYLRQAPWISIFPGAAIVLSVLSLNLLGDGLRDFLDPRLRYS